MGILIFVGGFLVGFFTAFGLIEYYKASDELARLEQEERQ